MKLKSLILGSVAAAGLTTAGFAADLGVLTSLDVCDTLGLSGLTISSDTNCVQISGNVSYEFNWGNYSGSYPAGVNGLTNPIILRKSIGFAPFTKIDRFDDAGSNDWETEISAWLQFVGTSSTDIGNASVHIKIKGDNDTVITNGVITGAGSNAVNLDEAYVSVGTDTVLLVGKKGSIANFESGVYNFTTLFGFSKTDPGTLYDADTGDNDGFGSSHSIQIVASLAEGVKAGIALENINGIGATGAAGAGNLVGILTYGGENLKAHATVFAAGILDGTVDAYGAHIGAVGTFDTFSLQGAFGYHYDVASALSDYAATISGQLSLDIFKIAASFEVLGGTNVNTDYGFGGSIGAKVTDGIEFNLGGKYFVSNNGFANAYHVAAQIKAGLTETIAATAEVGVYGNNAGASDFYGAGGLAWTPDTAAGGFTSSLGAEVHQNGGYKVTVKASKTFQ